MMNQKFWLKASGWMVGFSILTFLIGLILVPIVVLRLPADFFVKEEEEPHWHFPKTLPGWLFWLLRNITGAILILAGIAMLVLPGQGLLTIIAGVTAMTLPGKTKAMLWLVQMGGMQKTLNWISIRGRKAPLQFAKRIKRPHRKQAQQKAPD